MTKERKRELTEDFLKYEKYIYSILSTEKYKSKPGKSKKKVIIYNSHLLAMDFEDLVQEGRKYLWEALIRYGKFSPRSKTNKIASKSTFVYRHVYNIIINLGKKCSCKKYQREEVPLESLYNI